jgi:catechol 2,3-dioxygenase-like lactoylglutathione lyase family enzyme
MDQVVVKTALEPSLKLKFLSHGTLISGDLEATRKFYVDFLGLEVVRTSPISLMVRLGGQHVYACVYRKNHNSKMDFLFHNGLDVETQEEVDEAHATTVAEADKWGLTQITKPKLQHGTYSFLFWDMDLNCWEILSNPEGGYTWIFEQGDQEGKGHLTKEFERPGLKAE